MANKKKKRYKTSLRSAAQATDSTWMGCNANPNARKEAKMGFWVILWPIVQTCQTLIKCSNKLTI